MSLTAVLSRIDADVPQALDRLFELLRIPSISTDPAFRTACDRAADWLVKDLESIGIAAEKRVTPGHPMVVGHADGSGPHLLFYGHYDVQPVDPLELWDNDPFDPKLEDTAKGRVLRGRGTADDKGQLMTFIEACRAWKAEQGTLPCKITIFLEGEEESGSPSLVPFMEAHKDELRADLALICDTAMFESKTPAIVTMLRGMLQEEITITGPDKDLHSGYYGGIAINPIRVLSQIIATLHDETGRVTIPGFYDGVPELSDQMQAQWDALGFDHAAFLRDVDLSVPAGEQDRTPLEMTWSRPTCEVNGIWGGYTGEGFKTVLPAQAHAKISFRLVGDQDPLKIREALRGMITKMLPADCSVAFTAHGASKACVIDADDPRFEKALQALSEEWQVPAAYIGGGGSIPVAGYFQDILGTTPLLIGFGKDDDALHSPNEKYDLESFHKGMRSWARILAALT
ncbi:M20/M25/M40 family metallo-hydrolase [Roseobacter weihaiensis]|uniref:M20/M25/M40 family metallo-hydrolase n=1 Tax=Roseobacter weihaiensis TaxID=2763262 RepID=UPI001D0BD7EB|nr:M20/M25/M40 family metallo-hydrolase [Roseobacter sp. H9]